MSVEELRERIKRFAVKTVRFVEALPHNKTCHIIGEQLLRAGTSPGANYRAACRARSRADFIAKMKIVEEECDESIYWLELLVATGQVKSACVADLMREGSEILSITVASIKTARSRA